MEPQTAEKMTDSTSADPTAVPDPTLVAAVNGQCEQADSPQQQQQQQQQQSGTESQGEGLKMDQEMKITDSIEDGGRRCEIYLKFSNTFTRCAGARAHSTVRKTRADHAWKSNYT